MMPLAAGDHAAAHPLNKYVGSYSGAAAEASLTITLTDTITYYVSLFGTYIEFLFPEHSIRRYYFYVLRMRILFLMV